MLTAALTAVIEMHVPVQLFLTRALMPLHKPKCVGMYHQPLAYCVTQVCLSSARQGCRAAAGQFAGWLLPPKIQAVN